VLTCALSVASFVVAVFPIPLFLSSHHLSTPCRGSSFFLRCTRLTSQHPLHTQLFAIVPATMLHNITAQNRADSHGFYPHTSYLYSHTYLYTNTHTCSKKNHRYLCTVCAQISLFVSNSLSFSRSLLHVLTLQHIATNCNTLQCSTGCFQRVTAPSTTTPIFSTALPEATSVEYVYVCTCTYV